MLWTVDEREVRPGSIGPPPMNYGQHHRWRGCPRGRYRLRVERPELLRLLDGFIEQLCASEAEEIAAGYDAMELPAIEAFRAANLPGLAEMLDGERELLAALVDLFDLDVLEALASAPDVAAGETYHVLASIERCEVERDALTLEGVSYAVLLRVGSATEDEL